MIANFAEGQYIRIKFNEEWISETEHISLRFKVIKYNFFYLDYNK